MGVKKSGLRARARQVEHLSHISTFSGGARISRASLLAGASLVVLGALAAPDRALAACSGSPQTISTSRTGPVHSDGGAITVTASGSISGGPGSDGVDAFKCPITTLTNQSSGTISGGNGRTSAAGGAGVSNASTITTLSNSGTISGGNGGGVRAQGGAGVSNAKGATIGSLSNATRATISGGNGGGASRVATGGAGGAGVSNAGTITKLTNSGVISGGSGGGGKTGAVGGAGVSNAGTIRTL